MQTKSLTDKGQRADLHLSQVLTLTGEQIRGVLARLPFLAFFLLALHGLQIRQGSGLALTVFLGCGSVYLSSMLCRPPLLLVAGCLKHSF